VEIQERCLRYPNLLFYRREILIRLCLNEIDLAQAAEDMAETEVIEELLEDTPNTPFDDWLRESTDRLTEKTVSAFESGDRLIAVATQSMEALQAGCDKGVKDERRFVLFGSRVLICMSDCTEQYSTLGIDPRPEPDHLLP
jgi:hypothetical protein